MPKGKTNQQLAQDADMSHETLRKIEQLKQKASKEVKAKLEKNELSYAYKMAKRKS